MNYLIKLHKNGGDVTPFPGLKGFNVGNGTLVYVHNAKSSICRTFRGNMFSIFDNSFGDTDNTEWQIYLGTYEGRTERFEATNYLHQRAALLEHEGKRLEGRGAGVKTFNTVAAVGEKLVKVIEWQSTLATAIGQWVVKPQTKYFVAFKRIKNGADPLCKGVRIMHNQTNIFGLRCKGIMTLGQIFSQNSEEFMRCV